jgi:hypothetical protein
MVTLLEGQQSRKVDLVVPGVKMQYDGGMLVIADHVVDITSEGVTSVGGRYWPTATFDSHIAERLDIPISYLRRLANGRTYPSGKSSRTNPARLDLFDANVNGLLHGDGEDVPPDERLHYVRLLTPPDEEELGIAYALKSSKYGRLDNLDALDAMIKGIQLAGVDIAGLKIYGDLSETRMFLHVSAPGIVAAAPEFLRGYSSPFDLHGEGSKRRQPALTMEERIAIGARWRETHHLDSAIQPGSEPIICAGFRITNSEVGMGRWGIEREWTILVCGNGMTASAGKFEKTHLGGEQEQGQIEWSKETREAELTWVINQTKDVVQASLSQEILEADVAKVEAKSGKEIDEPEKVIQVVSQRLSFTEHEQAAVLRHLMLSRQMSSAGVANAVSSVAQTVEDPDRSNYLSGSAVEALEMVFAMR